MNLTSKQTIKALLQKENAKPIKRLGQNFLISKNILDKIIKAADIKNSDTILEIGAGIGALTQELALRARKVIAIEKDKNLIAVLEETLRDFNNIEIICADALKINLQNYKLPSFAKASEGQANYKLISNLPYYITSPLIRKFLEMENPPEQMVLMVQKEVAQRICAKPPKMNLLAIAVQSYSQPKIISYVSKKNFWPQPKVDSAIIKLKVEDGGWRVERGEFFKIVKAGFSHPRKQLINNLTVGLKKDKSEIEDWLVKNNINPQARAQHLCLDDWINLSRVL